MVEHTEQREGVRDDDATTTTTTNTITTTTPLLFTLACSPSRSNGTVRNTDENMAARTRGARTCDSHSARRTQEQTELWNALVVQQQQQQHLQQQPLSRAQNTDQMSLHDNAGSPVEDKQNMILVVK
jgi:hypothetical protein